MDRVQGHLSSPAYDRRMDAPTVVDQEAFEVARVEAADGAAGADAAFDHLEGRMPTVEGRRMYGVLYPGEPDRYFACVRLDGDDDDFGFERATVPGGRYGCRLVLGWSARIAEFPRIVDALRAELGAAGHPVDPSRPVIEFYRRDEELLMMAPVLEDGGRLS